MKAHEFHAAAVAVARGRSWADAVEEIAATLSLAEVGEIHAEVGRLQHDATHVLLDKLRALGGRHLDWCRCYETRLDAWWRVSPIGEVSYCCDPLPSADLRDWIAEGDVDPAKTEGDRVQTLADDVTLILTDGMGAMAFRTSKRV